MNYLLYNPLSNNGRGLSTALDRYKADSANTISNTKYINLLDLDLRHFLQERNASDSVILCGGDGTLNQFLNLTDYAHCACELRYLKAGSGNDFIKDLSVNAKALIPLKPHLQQLPYLQVQGKTYRFLNNVGFGVDGECCRVADEMRAAGKRHINYALIILRLVCKGYQYPTATVWLDDEAPFTLHRVYIAPTLHGRYYGGGIKIAPQQQRNQGSLAFVALHTWPRWKAIPQFPAIIAGTFNHPGMVMRRYGLHRVHVEFSQPMALQIDGEVIRDVTEYTAWV